MVIWWPRVVLFSYTNSIVFFSGELLTSDTRIEEIFHGLCEVR